MSRVRISFPAPHKKRIGFTPIRFFVLRGKRVVANSPVRVTEQSLIAREYAEGLPCKSNEVDFAQGKRHYLVFTRSVERETSRIETRQFACRLHIAIDIRRGSRKIVETILRKDTALSRFHPLYLRLVLTRKFASRLHIAIDIRRGSRKKCQNNSSISRPA